MEAASSWIESFWTGGSECSNSSPDDETSVTSYSTVSSYGFVLDDNYMIITRANAIDDDLSDIVDSVADNRSISSGEDPARVPSGRYRGACNLNAIKEEEEPEEYEAYLRAKMSSLWLRIQEAADREDLSESPSSEEDTSLLKAYEKKKNAFDV
jgi:hypothetical protein